MHEFKCYFVFWLHFSRQSWNNFLTEFSCDHFHTLKYSHEFHKITDFFYKTLNFFSNFNSTKWKEDTTKIYSVMIQFAIAYLQLGRQVAKKGIFALRSWNMKINTHVYIAWTHKKVSCTNGLLQTGSRPFWIFCFLLKTNSS